MLAVPPRMASTRIIGNIAGTLKAKKAGRKALRVRAAPITIAWMAVIVTTMPIGEVSIRNRPASPQTRPERPTVSAKRIASPGLASPVVWRTR